MKSYRNIVRAVSETPWAMRPERLAVILDLIEFKAAGGTLTPEQVQARIGAAPVSRQVTRAGAVAVLPLSGAMVPHASIMTEISGGTSVSAFSAMFAQAIGDPSIDAILINVDSPGGMTDLVPELAAQIRDARGTKPVVAIANTGAASAAYWIAAQADEIVVTPSGSVGSIGVFAAHTDISALQEKAGVSTTLISAGKFKTEASPFAPLGEEALAAIQARVDTFYGMFVHDVALGRGTTDAAVRDGYGQGRLMTAQAAVAAGMADRVATFDETLLALAQGPAAAQASRMGTGASARVCDMSFDADPNLKSAPVTDEPLAESDAPALESQVSFSDEAEALSTSAKHLVTRTASLAEVERGHLTVSKREHLTACTGELHDATDALDALLVATDPDKRSDDVLRQRLRYERQRSR